MSWVFIAVIAYFFHALNAVTDKFLLGDRIPKPSSFAFYVSVFGLASFLLLPFGRFFILPKIQIANAFISGAASTLALFLFFTAMKRQEASRVSTLIGGFSPIFVFILSYFLLGSLLSRNELIAFILLVSGGVLISLKHRHQGPVVSEWNSREVILITLASSFLFAIGYVFEKSVFNHTTFINGFIWTRLGSFTAALLFLIPRSGRESILRLPRIATKGTVGIFAANKALSAAGFFLTSYAVSLGTVSLVNAMQGIEYALVFLITFFISKRFPFILEEEVSPQASIQKIAAILLIAWGLYLLA